MYESKSFVYLDVQKTGTTFIFDFLRRFSIEGKVHRKKHKPVGDRYSAEKLHFISVRDPLDQYISLYSFGCAGEGGVFRRLERKGRGGLYAPSAAAFGHWLEFMLDPSNAMLFEPAYAKAANGCMPNLTGFQSFRFLSLAFRDPAETFATCSTKQDLVKAYRTKSIISITIRHSHFASDLKNLVKNHLRGAIADQGAALKFLDEAPALNKSDRFDRDGELIIDQPVGNLLREREWLYYDGIVET